MPSLNELVNRQANRIDQILWGYNVGAQVLGGDILPRLIVHRLSLKMGVKISAVEGLSRELAVALGVDNVRVAPRRGSVVVEVPRADGKNVHLSGLMSRLMGVPACAPLLGIDESGTPLVLCLASPDVGHVLVAGTTGAGKTVLGRTMILTLAAYNAQRRVQLALLDPKGRAYRGLEELPHVLFRESDTVRSVARTRWLVEEMLRRDEEGRSEPRIVLFIDELADLVMSSGEQLQDLLTRLTQRGREAGIHVVACTQKPTAEIMGALSKANFPTRLVGRVPSADVAAVCAGVPSTGAEVLQGRGDFVLVCGEGIERVQVAWATDSEARDVVQKLAVEGPTVRLPLDEALITDLHMETRVGRPTEEVTAEMVARIQEYQMVQREWPSARWVRQEFACGHARAVRAIERAREGREGGKMERNDEGSRGKDPPPQSVSDVSFRSNHE